MQTQAPDPVKLFFGALLRDLADDEALREHLEARFAPLDYVSEAVPFDCTDYYEAEMGAGLWRRFYSVGPLIDPGDLAAVKLASNALEDLFLDPTGGRRVNLDPGYMDPHKVVLASAKYGAPKIYIGQGIYADPTLWYRKGVFHPYEWGFPDFRSGRYNAILLEIRARYKRARRETRAEG